MHPPTKNERGMCVTKWERGQRPGIDTIKHHTRIPIGNLKVGHLVILNAVQDIKLIFSIFVSKHDFFNINSHLLIYNDYLLNLELPLKSTHYSRWPEMAEVV